jgi:7-cyano-7-deazaguanine synthase
VTQRRAVVLLSGGLDSTTAAALTRREGFEWYALTVRYGQVHEAELAAARRVAEALGARRHVELAVDLAAFGGSSLTGDGAIPKDRPLEASDIPSTYVPARNTVLLSTALAWAETLGAERIVIGVNALDYSGYPDCRPDYIAAYEAMANLATKAGVEGTGRFAIHTPLISLTKAEIIRKGLALGVDYSRTHSCYDPSPEGLACGLCDSCRLRLKGFAEAGVPDPVRYDVRSEK